MTRPPDLPLPAAAGTLVLVALALSLTPALTPSDAQGARASATWTFSQPGVSRVSFSPPLTGDGRVLRLEMSFRTLEPNGLLAYQDVPERGGEGGGGEGKEGEGEEKEGEEEEEEISRLLDSFRLVVEMSQGHLRVGHMFDHYKDILNIGRGRHSV